LSLEGVAAVTYKATASREGKYWVVDIKGVGVTQGRNAAEATAMARDLIAVMEDIPLDQVQVSVEFKVTGVDQAEVSHVRQAVTDAAEAQERAATESRKLAAKLIDAGLSGRDVAEVLGVSPQRVSQLISRGRGRSEAS
jgi:DNA-directed RNA polymerase specialized sigma24 family protein